MSNNTCPHCGGKGCIEAWDLITLIEEAALKAIGLPPRRRVWRKCLACWGTGRRRINVAEQRRRWRER